MDKKPVSQREQKAIARIDDLLKALVGFDEKKVYTVLLKDFVSEVKDIQTGLQTGQIRLPLPEGTVDAISYCIGEGCFDSPKIEKLLDRISLLLHDYPEQID